MLFILEERLLAVLTLLIFFIRTKSGPDSNKIYDVDGYTTYIPQEFPKLDYIDRCYIVDEVRLGNGMSDGEL